MASLQTRRVKIKAFKTYRNTYSSLTINQPKCVCGAETILSMRQQEPFKKPPDFHCNMARLTRSLHHRDNFYPCIHHLVAEPQAENN